MFDNKKPDLSDLFGSDDFGKLIDGDPDTIKKLSKDAVKELARETMKKLSIGSYIKAVDKDTTAEVEMRGTAISLMALSMTIVRNVFQQIASKDEDITKAYISSLSQLILEFISQRGGDDE